MTAILQARNIEKYYGNKNNLTKALNGISFDVDMGEFMGVMGASGSGKTTLLNCISTIDTATSGQILIDGADITAMNPKSLAKFRREELG
ncbi:MAG: ATP-binding cassette domain-containing protein, partial [Clostridiales Family XIII bacterium]|nr:ATP-binding cassette domain-containing protein [Clostridiales Family XIII bacterium]